MVFCDNNRLYSAVCHGFLWFCDISQHYEFLLYLLKEMNRNMKTIDELKQEVAQTRLPEKTKELFYQVLDTADVASLTEYDRIQYESDLKNYMDTMSCIKFATLKGREEGREEGFRQGLIKTALRLKEKGISLEDIVDITGLTAEEVAGL